MILNNFKTILINGVLNSNSTGTTAPTTTNFVYLRNTSNQNRVCLISSESNFNSMLNALNHFSTDNSSTSLHIKCGYGTTPVTADDYFLDMNLNLTCVSCTGGINNGVKTVTATFNNGTGADATITEVGLFVNFIYNGSATDVFMIKRKVLDTPITIPAGESRAVVYELSLED